MSVSRGTERILGMGSKENKRELGVFRGGEVTENDGRGVGKVRGDVRRDNSGSKGK